MRVLSLGVGMFDWCIHQKEKSINYLEDSLLRLIEEHQVDVAMLQEVRYSKLRQLQPNFQTILPYPYAEKSTVDFHNHLCIAAYPPDNQWIFHQSYLNEVAGKYMVSIRNPTYWTVLGLHMPLLLKRTHEAVFERLLLDQQHWHLIVGNFNAHVKKPNSTNWQLLQTLTTGKDALYRDLWSEGLAQNKAYYLDYRGEKRLANQSYFYRTTANNTQIDYILGRNVELHEIILDMRTLSFTNHCALIVDCNKR